MTNEVNEQVLTYIEAALSKLWGRISTEDLESVRMDLISAKKILNRDYHRIIETAYGDVMVKQGEVEGTLECYNGDNFDDYIGEIEGSLNDDDEGIKIDIENYLF